MTAPDRVWPVTSLLILLNENADAVPARARPGIAP